MAANIDCAEESSFFTVIVREQKQKARLMQAFTFAYRADRQSRRFRLQTGRNARVECRPSNSTVWGADHQYNDWKWQAAAFACSLVACSTVACSPVVCSPGACSPVACSPVACSSIAGLHVHQFSVCMMASRAGDRPAEGGDGAGTLATSLFQ